MHFARHAEHGVAQDHAGVALFAGAHPYPGPYTNGVIRTDPSIPEEAVLTRAAEFFSPLRRGYAVWTAAHADADLDDLCRDRGMFPRLPEDGLPAMVVSVPPATPDPPSGATLVRVTEEAQALDYVGVVADAYDLAGIPGPTAAAMFFSPVSVLVPNVAAFVAYLGREPVSGAMALVDGDAGCVVWAATVDRARRRGLGLLTAAHATAAAFDLGAQIVTLQASQLGLPMWRRLGYLEVTRYRRWLAKSPVA